MGNISQLARQHNNFILSQGGFQDEAYFTHRDGGSTYKINCFVVDIGLKTDVDAGLQMIDRKAEIVVSVDEFLKAKMPVFNVKTRHLDIEDWQVLYSNREFVIGAGIYDRNLGCAIIELVESVDHNEN